MVEQSRTAVIDWIREPSTDSGLYVATDTAEQGGWGYVSYAELSDLSRRIAARLQEDGVGIGGAVCVVMPTDALCVATLYAIWVCGATATLIAPPTFGDAASYVAHVAAILRSAAPHTVVTSPELNAIINQAAEAGGLRRPPINLDDREIDNADPAELREPGECALVQFTSGSTAQPRGVMVSWENLRDNIALIASTINWRDGDATASWLPLYHDMGLIGSLLMTVSNQGSLYLMRPDQFIREPIRWLRCMTGAQHSVSPSFGIGYAARRLGPDDVAGLDLSGWRSLVTGAEPVDLACMSAFCDLTRPLGFNPNAFIPAYGLAEATLIVTGKPGGEPVPALRVDSGSLRMGAGVEVVDSRIFDGQALPGDGWIAGLGPHGTEVAILDDNGDLVPDGTLGQIVVESSSVAIGYSDASTDEAGGGTRFQDGKLYTGDAGFRHDGQLYALGRMGWALKVRGKTVFMEDLEARLASAAGLGKNLCCAAAIPGTPVPAIALFVERPEGEWLGAVRRALRSDLGPAHMLRVVTGPRGLIQRTSSGKPRRGRMLQMLAADELTGASVIFDSVEGGVAGTRDGGTPLPDGRHIPFSIQQLNQLLDETLKSVEVEGVPSILLEGSLAEGFGNDGSDIDFLAVVPGDVPAPTMPTVLFIDGRRTEIRTRTVDQMRYQLQEVARALKEPASALLDWPGNDLINRCQRFLHAVELRKGATWPAIEELRAALPYPEFGSLVSRWWMARAQQSLRQSVAYMAFGAPADAKAWARDGLQQAAKGWAAVRGECYVETKWLPLQLNRIKEPDVGERYRTLDAALAEGSAVAGSAELLDETIALATELGVTDIANDPAMVRLSRVPGVTTWPIGNTLHVLRNEDVFALSEDAGKEWRTVVFGRPITEAADRRPHGYLAEFVRLGLVGMRWHGEGPIRPAIAMCDPARPYTCPPSIDFPLVSIGGAPAPHGVWLSPLPARRFVECGMNLIWSNILVENSREDLVGAVKSSQWGVADLAKMRLVGVLVRALASACGSAPMPPDVAALSTVERLLDVREGHSDGAALLELFREAICMTFDGPAERADEAPAKLAVLDNLVHGVRDLSGCEFPASFNSREQWRLTLDAGYNWLRMGSYLNADLPLDEARDLLTAGGNQPHGRAQEASR